MAAPPSPTLLLSFPEPQEDGQYNFKEKLETCSSLFHRIYLKINLSVSTVNFLSPSVDQIDINEVYCVLYQVSMIAEAAMVVRL
jgi:hypothetical protein